MHLDDTIVAIATPPGRGGIGVVRLSGSDARSIAATMLRLAHDLEAGRAHFGELIDPGTGERIDEVVATFFAKPHSYTTDDVVEISCHGSPVVLRHVVEMALARGARLAEPGEFTMRAFLNGRIDLTQAEAVRDLIDSQTLYQAQVAARQLEGALSKRLQPIKQKLVELIAIHGSRRRFRRRRRVGDSGRADPDTHRRDPRTLAAAAGQLRLRKSRA